MAGITRSSGTPSAGGGTPRARGGTPRAKKVPTSQPSSAPRGSSKKPGPERHQVPIKNTLPNFTGTPLEQAKEMAAALEVRTPTRHTRKLCPHTRQLPRYSRAQSADLSRKEKDAAWQNIWHLLSTEIIELLEAQPVSTQCNHIV
jgi:hypothetical protein